jgi:5-methylcytosine-specific restriction protein A
MARYPDWGRDERILALDLYLSEGQLGPGTAKVKELSAILKGMAAAGVDLPMDYRSESSIALKLGNFAALDPRYTGYGLPHVAAGDQEVWDEFHDDRPRLTRVSGAIRQLVARGDAALQAEDDEEESAPEGRLLYRLHVRRERNQRLVAQRKARSLKEFGSLACEVCGFDFADVFGSQGDGFIECHHRIALSLGLERRTSQNDLALVCANCHRMLHRGAAWPSVEELRERVSARCKERVEPGGRGDLR